MECVSTSVLAETRHSDWGEMLWENAGDPPWRLVYRQIGDDAAIAMFLETGKTRYCVREMHGDAIDEILARVPGTKETTVYSTCVDREHHESWSRDEARHEPYIAVARRHQRDESGRVANCTSGPGTEERHEFDVDGIPSLPAELRPKFLDLARDCGAYDIARGLESPERTLDNGATLRLM